jgi:UDP-N-acetylmuramate--alanine ligase
VTMTDLRKVKNVHFVGIGGIGISAIARMMIHEGKKVTGSDRDASRVTDELVANGVKVMIGHSEKHIPADCDLVVHTVAVPPENLELTEARRRKVPVMTYPEMLREISKEKFTIAISGTHGKTTTTAMIAKILIDAGLEPTIIVGSLLKDGSNFISGKSKYLVVEADEYRNAFHNLEPQILVINNIDEDHLDFFKDITDIQASFRGIAKKVPADGFVICNRNDENIFTAVKNIAGSVIDYSEFKKLLPKLQIPGDHNRSNAAAAFAVARALELPDDAIIRALAAFEGVWRRFEYIGEMESGALVYDDYAHNPQKVRAALQGAREMFPEKRIIAVFMPHLYSRTKLLKDEFAKSFADADEVIVSDIFPAREPYDSSITSEMLAEEIKKFHPNAKCIMTFQSIEKYLRENAKKDDVIITIGAGDVYKVGESIIISKH